MLAGGLDDRQLMDLVFTVGTYELLAMVFRSFGVQLGSRKILFASVEIAAIDQALKQVLRVMAGFQNRNRLI